MAELKPCPFCGGNARISADTEATRDSQGRLWAFNAVCDRCCATSGLTFKPEKAIEAWNRRVPQTEVHQYGENCTSITNCGTLNLNL